MHILRLIAQVMKRWSEEPVGLIYGLFVYFALRVPNQISDMLTSITIHNGQTFIRPQNFPLLLGFVFSGLLLACVTWFWLTVVNRTEITMNGGRLEEFRQTGKVDPRALNYPVWPYRMAAASASSMILISVFVAVLGPFLGSVLPGDGAIALILELLFLLSCSLFLGCILAAVTGDGYDYSTSEHNVAEKKKDLNFLKRMNEKTRREWIKNFRLTSMPGCSEVCQLSAVNFWVGIVLSVLTVFLLLALSWGGIVELASSILIVLITGFVNFWFLRNIRFRVAGYKTEVPDNKWLNVVQLLLLFVQVLIITYCVLFTVFVATDYLEIHDYDWSISNSTSSLVLVAMACSVGPLVLLLTALRDLAEFLIRIFAFFVPIDFGIRDWPGLAAHIFSGRLNLKLSRSDIKQSPSFIMKRLSYKERDADQRKAHIFRRMGRVTAVVLFALILILPAPIIRGNCYWPAVQNCELYEIKAAKSSYPIQRPNVQQALETWKTARFGNARDNTEIPVIVIAASGGASRAAAWLLRVMKEIQDQQGTAMVDGHVFAISAVSGGALGAVTYALNETHPDLRALSLDKVEDLASRDLLSNTASTLFSVDLLRRVPFAPYALNLSTDRNQILEAEFEELWQKTWGFEMNFEEVNFAYSCEDSEKCKHSWGAPNRTHLLLNGVDAVSGQRMVTSTIDISADPKMSPSSIDFVNEFKKSVKLSSAVMNSARFPIISPAGHYKAKIVPGLDPVSRQIIDGGYFEGSGVETALELISEIERLSATGKLSFTPVPALLLITNAATAEPIAGNLCKNSVQDMAQSRAGMSLEKLSTELAKKDYFHLQNLTCDDGSLRALRRQEKIGLATRVSEIFAPLQGLLGAHRSHGSEALLEARARLCKVKRTSSDLSENAPDLTGENQEPSLENRFFHVGLPKPICTNHSAPMNWVLNDRTKDFFSQSAIYDPHVQWQLEELYTFVDSYSEN